MSDFDDLLLDSPKFQKNPRKLNENISINPNLTGGFPNKKIETNTNENFSNTMSKVNAERPSLIGFSRRDRSPSKSPPSKNINTHNNENNFEQPKIIEKKNPIIIKENLNPRGSNFSNERNSDANSLRNSQKKEKLKNPNISNTGLVNTVSELVLNDENAKNKINQLTEEIKREKENHKRDIEEYKRLIKEKEDECNKEIQKLNIQNKDYQDNILKEERFKQKEQSLNKEINRLKNDINEQIKNERERLSIIHKAEYENKEKLNRKLLDEQQMNFEKQNEIIKKQIEQQNEFFKLAQKVENSSKQINDIVNKLSNEKFQQNKENQNIKSDLEKLEENLKLMEENLKNDRARLLKEKEAFEKEQTERMEFNNKENSRIQSEIKILEDLIQKMKENEIKEKEKFQRDNIDNQKINNDLESELNNLKSIFQNEEKEIEYQKKLLNEDKKHFESEKNDKIKNLDAQKLEWENRRERYLNDDIELKGREKAYNDKIMFLNDQFDLFRRQKFDINEELEKVNRDENDILSASKNFDKIIQSHDEKERELRILNEEIIREKNQLENEKMLINLEITKLNEQKNQLKEKISNLNNIKYQYATQAILSNNLNNNLYPKNNDYNMNSRSNFNNNYNDNSSTLRNLNFNPGLTSNSNRFNMNNISQYPTQTIKSDTKFYNSNLNKKPFKADEYLNERQNKLKNQQILNGNVISNDSFLMKEKEYLKQSNENFMRNTKKEYQNMKNDYMKGLSTSSNQNMMLKKEEEVYIDPSIISANKK